MNAWFLFHFTIGFVFRMNRSVVYYCAWIAVYIAMRCYYTLAILFRLFIMCIHVDLFLLEMAKHMCAYSSTRRKIIQNLSTSSIYGMRSTIQYAQNEANSQGTHIQLDRYCFCSNSAKQISPFGNTLFALLFFKFFFYCILCLCYFRYFLFFTFK